MTGNLPALRYPRPPAQVAPYVEALGVELAIRFLLEFGGAELYLSEDPKGRSRLEALVGYDRAKALGTLAHVLPRRVPLAKRWLAHCLDARGESTAEIARTLRVSDTTVRAYLKSGRMA